MIEAVILITLGANIISNRATGGSVQSFQLRKTVLLMIT